MKIETMPECAESPSTTGSVVTRPYTAPPRPYAMTSAANLFGSISPAGVANIMLEQRNRAFYNAVPTAIRRGPRFELQKGSSYHWLVYKSATGSRYQLKFEKGAVKGGPQQRRYKCTACAVPFEIRVVDGKSYSGVDPDSEFVIDGKQHSAACTRQEDPRMLVGCRKRRSPRTADKLDATHDNAAAQLVVTSGRPLATQADGGLPDWAQEARVALVTTTTTTRVVFRCVEDAAAFKNATTISQ